MRRTLALTAVFALAVIAVVALASWFTYGRVRVALEEEFGRRVEWVAAAGAADVLPRQIAVLEAGEPSGFAVADSLVLALGAVRRSSQAARVFLLDPAGIVLLDSESDSLLGRRAPLTAAEGVAFAAARGGAPSHGEPRTLAGRRVLVGFAPVRGADANGPVAGVLGVEASAEFLAVLPEIGRLLATTALLAGLAVLVLSLLFFRLAAAQAGLERSLSRAENLASVGELAATLAHEVRNPLGVIDGAAKRLAKGYAGAEPELFGYIADEVARLERLVRRYLEFARPTAPTETAGLAEATAVTLALLEPSATERKVALVREWPDGDATRVRLGGEEMKQILFNLVRNAIEAMPEGGTIRVGWAPAGTTVRVHVADDGPGMPQDVTAKAVRPFFTTRAQGTGLGLAIVDRLAREAGGSFRLESAPGRGTTCVVTLPRAPEIA